MAKQHAHKYQDKNSSGGSTQHEGHEMHNGHNGMKHDDHNTGQGHEGHKGGDHHTHMVADFRRRFLVSLALTIPVLAGTGAQVHRRPLRALRTLLGYLLLWGVSLPQGTHWRTEGCSAGHDDPDCHPLPMYTAVLWYSACRARYSFGSSLP